jgi:hypothetical protein
MALDVAVAATAGMLATFSHRHSTRAPAAAGRRAAAPRACPPECQIRASLTHDVGPSTMDSGVHCERDGISMPG